MQTDLTAKIDNLGIVTKAKKIIFDRQSVLKFGGRELVLNVFTKSISIIMAEKQADEESAFLQ